MKQAVWVKDGFFPQAAALRSAFQERFADPRATRSDRFVWDYWHVPDQYTLVRTPADHFFPTVLYRNFLRRLTAWGRSTLGCAALTPPWLSYYVEGCEQKLHSDLPHGPWAYVFSLSPRRKKFQGGETMLLRPQTLAYWQNFQDAQDREYQSFVRRIPALFNRLVVFDPRIPHGVTPVRGTHDPREARLVVHGWFTDPKPCLEGALSAAKVAPVLDEAVGRFVEEIRGLGQWHGILSLSLRVGASGLSAKPLILADSLVNTDARGEERRLRALVLARFAGLRFPKAKAPTKITLPLLFR